MKEHTAESLSNKDQLCDRLSTLQREIADLPSSPTALQLSRVVDTLRKLTNATLE